MKDKQLGDVYRAEKTRGKKQKPLVTIERERMIRELALKLRDPKCEESDYLEVIRGFELSEEDPLYRELVQLWRKRRGRS